jgi:wyosine [tRNA(Phe)-imidazoG37] synthetase (radical SAM superfamily)
MSHVQYLQIKTMSHIKYLQLKTTAQIQLKKAKFKKFIKELNTSDTNLLRPKVHVCFM